MTQLSRYFTLAELTVSSTARQRGISNTPDPAHLENLRVTAHRMDAVRQILDRPIIPTSAYRNPTVNRLVGGVSNSDHALGWAVDFNGTIAEARRLADKLDHFDQLILERDGRVIHISFNPRARREVLTQKGGPGTPVQRGLIP